MIDWFFSLGLEILIFVCVPITVLAVIFSRNFWVGYNLGVALPIACHGAQSFTMGLTVVGFIGLILLGQSGWVSALLTLWGAVCRRPNLAIGGAVISLPFDAFYVLVFVAYGG